MLVGKMYRVKIKEYGDFDLLYMYVYMNIFLGWLKLVYRKLLSIFLINFC